ncbi:uncharacterized protein BYT42DRAFT_617283 [Radiomyces spectabilis]|uniref:uncharacterized protein n=1 Tax=Radiomyces spectabilis TaxID=64574 RepID=UPI00221E7067|nr:uncharacterized protein BYT42DRAFT_617283 [Radiomyces spectabilis]KAI8369241.1 hypothetical protein BYT42DRAFT_617283 [Radiomyces spectabilis]
MQNAVSSFIKYGVLTLFSSSTLNSLFVNPIFAKLYVESKNEDFEKALKTAEKPLYVLTKKVKWIATKGPDSSGLQKQERREGEDEDEDEDEEKEKNLTMMKMSK